MVSGCLGSGGGMNITRTYHSFTIYMHCCLVLKWNFVLCLVYVPLFLQESVRFVVNFCVLYHRETKICRLFMTGLQSPSARCASAPNAARKYNDVFSTDCISLTGVQNFVIFLLNPQPGRSRVQFQMVSLEFFIDIILPAVLWPWDRLSL